MMPLVRLDEMRLDARERNSEALDPCDRKQ